MKKFPRFFCLLLVLLFLFAPAAVYSKEYTFMHGQATVRIPDSFDVLHRELGEDDPLFRKYRYSKDMLRKDGIYFDAISTDAGCEIVLSENGDTETDIYSLSDGEIKSMGREIKESLLGQGIKIASVSVYESHGLKYIRLSGTSNEYYPGIVLYVTTSGGKVFSIVMHTSASSSADYTQKTLTQIINSLSLPSPGQNTGSWLSEEAEKYLGRYFRENLLTVFIPSCIFLFYSLNKSISKKRSVKSIKKEGSEYQWVHEGHCPKCGAKIPSVSRYCYICGRKLRED